MKGFYFKESLLNLFLLLLVLSGITNALLPFVEKEVPESKNRNLEINGTRIELTDIIRICILITQINSLKKNIILEILDNKGGKRLK